MNTKEFQSGYWEKVWLFWQVEDLNWPPPCPNALTAPILANIIGPIKRWVRSFCSPMLWITSIKQHSNQQERKLPIHTRGEEKKWYMDTEPGFLLVKPSFSAVVDLNKTNLHSCNVLIFKIDCYRTQWDNACKSPNTGKSTLIAFIHIDVGRVKPDF